MNIKYDFTQPGGFPFDQGILNDLQNAMVEAEAAISAIVGPLAIMSGCVVANGVATSGIVAINGVLMPFAGGAVSANVAVVQTPSQLAYQNGSQPQSKVTQYAAFNDDGPLVWANFIRVSTEGVVSDIASLNTDIATLGAEITDLENTRAIKLASGNYVIGDVPAAYPTFTIPIGKTLANTQYMVLTSIVSLSGTPGNDLVDTISVINKGLTSFELFLHEPGPITQDISIDWMLIAL